MPSAVDTFFPSDSATLFLHFDVSDHFLDLDTFIGTARQAEQIVRSLDAALFGGMAEAELLVLPPKDGTFLARLGIHVSKRIELYAVIVAIGTFIDTDNGSAFIEGLTGRVPDYWYREIGKSIRGSVEGVISDVQNLTESLGQETDAATLEEQCKIASQFLKEMSVGILERPSAELNRMVEGNANLELAAEAKAEFFRVCLDDPAVKALGFTSDGEFPIPRNGFAERSVPPKRRDDGEEELPWVVSTEYIKVTSPNWDKDDQASRHWKGKDGAGRDCLFVIEDEGFWLHVKTRDLPVSVLDNLKVQWAHQVIAGRIKNRRVLRVLEFNGEELALPLSDDAIEAILGAVSSRVSSRDNRQVELFDNEDRETNDDT